MRMKICVWALLLVLSSCESARRWTQDQVDVNFKAMEYRLSDPDADTKPDLIQDLTILLFKQDCCYTGTRETTRVFMGKEKPTSGKLTTSNALIECRIGGGNCEREVEAVQAVMVDTFPGKPFHDDSYVIALSDFLLKQSDVFIETGFAEGDSLAHVAYNYPHLEAYSCDINEFSYHLVLRRLNFLGLKNAHIKLQSSEEMLRELAAKFPATTRPFIYLDAHGWELPLRAEIDAIGRMFHSAWILIDDFQHPLGLNQADEWYRGYDDYPIRPGQNPGDGTINFQHCAPAFPQDRQACFYYPDYLENTSLYPLRGVGVFGIGDACNTSLPPYMRRGGSGPTGALA